MEGGKVRELSTVSCGNSEGDVRYIVVIGLARVGKKRPNRHQLEDPWL